jgi:hypothetical protein
MTTSDVPAPLADGQEAIRCLFEFAISRLQERGILMEYAPSAIDWLLSQPDWLSSLNPIRSLDGTWHKRVANVIEGLLLGGQLRAGDALWVGASEAPSKSELQFVVSPPADRGVRE